MASILHQQQLGPNHAPASSAPILRRTHRRACTPACAPQPLSAPCHRSVLHAQAPQQPATACPQVEQVLASIRHTWGVPVAPVTSQHPNQEVVMSGIGRHLGINIQWRIRWRADGAFQESITGRELGFEWGFDGGSSSSCWEMDSSGVARTLECDDHEALLVGAWIRTGLWLQPELSSRLEIQLEQSPASRTSSTASSSSVDSSGSSSRLRPRRVGRKRTVTVPRSDSATGQPQSLVNQPQSPVGQSQSPLTSQSSVEEPESLVLTIRLAGGKLLNRVRVCPGTWSVQGLDQPLCGDVEVWQFGTWRLWRPSVTYPEHVSHQANAGGHHVYVAQSCHTGVPSPLLHFQVWRAGSGHLLIRPRINDQEGGYMVVDTGASGFVITPSAAVALGLESFGELFAASISGKVPARFVKARSWSLGPLRITAPVMMTMAMDGLVKDGPEGGEVIGIVGYDIFRRAVIELPQMRPQSKAVRVHPPQLPEASQPQHSQAASGPLPFLQGLWNAAGGSWSPSRSSVHSSVSSDTVACAGAHPTAGSSMPSVTSSHSTGDSITTPNSSPASAAWSLSGCQEHVMRLYNPDHYDPAYDPSWCWHPFQMIASLPHLEVEFLGADQQLLRVLLMMDSGACGADIMLHARAMRELDLHRLSRPTSHFVRGVGGSGSDNSVRVEMVDLEWVELAGVRFSEVKCMYAGVGGLDISVYSAGILCGDLLTRLPTCFDYARKRIGFRLQP